MRDAISQGFVHLHTHSEYSLLDGLSRLRDLVRRAKELEMPALALTDHGALYGAVDFHHACNEAGIKPIIGVETYIARNSRFDRDARSDGHGRPFHLVLLATSFKGYQNLTRLVTAAHLEGYYYRPRMDKELLRAHSEGLIALSACLNGEVARAIQDGGLDAAAIVAEEYRDIFGADGFFLELMDHGIPEQAVVNEGIREISRRTGIPLVVTNDSHYVRAEDAEAQDIMVCIQQGKTVEQPDRLKMVDHPELYLKTAQQMHALFPNDGAAVERTLEIAARCELTLPSELRLPHFEVPGGRTPDEQLRAMAYAGVTEKYGELTPALRERVEHELGVIAKMGYSAYILIVQDFIRFAHERRILTAVRGSAGGSLVNYCIGLTDIDPLKYGLIFDRFLNLERYTQPDIDVDFMDDRRDEVIAYVTQKYGADRVAQIVTFNTMLARAAVRDTARVLGMPYADADRVAKIMPTGPTAPPLAESRKFVRELQEMETDPRIERLLDLAEKVEGLVRSTGTHAAGVVITRDPLSDLVPLERSKGNPDALQTQYEDKQLEKLGLLKFDFLGLGNLTILDRALSLIREQRGIEIDRERIPLDDAKTFALLSSGETTGLFQLESAGMRRHIRDLRPDRVEDVMAMVALFRPGPMEYIPSYIRRKHGQEPVTYAHPSLEPVLRETYGVMVYQEDVMAVTQALAGFTLGEADVLCYAIRKKIRGKLDAQREKFVTKAAERGVSKDIIETVWKDFEPFAQYGFNRAHAAIYGLIAYHTAYLKANYTPEYMTAVLSADMGNSDKIAVAIAECRRMGFEVRPPDVNRSRFDFVVGGNEIRFGLGGIKNVGAGAVDNIVQARDAAGPFRSLDDLCARIDLQRNNKRVLESLIKSGACDAFGPRLAQLDRLDAVLATAQREQKDRASGQVSLFDLTETVAPVAAAASPVAGGIEASRKDLLSWEKELLGIYVSEHPLQEISASLGGVVTAYLAELKEVEDDVVIVAGVITAARRHITQKKALMMFAQLEDLTASVEVLVFPKTYEATHQVWKTDEIVIVLARVERRDEEPKLLAEYAVPFSEAAAADVRRRADDLRANMVKRKRFMPEKAPPAATRAALPPVPAAPNGNGGNGHGKSEVVIRFREALDYDRSVALFQRIQVALSRHAGGTSVFVELPRADQGVRRIATSFRADPSPALVSEIQTELGEGLVDVLLPGEA